MGSASASLLLAAFKGVNDTLRIVSCCTLCPPGAGSRAPTDIACSTLTHKTVSGAATSLLMGACIPRSRGLHLLLEALQQQPLLLALLLQRVYDVAQQSTLPGLALLQTQSKSCRAAALLLGGLWSNASPAMRLLRAASIAIAAAGHQPAFASCCGPSRLGRSSALSTHLVSLAQLQGQHAIVCAPAAGLKPVEAQHRHCTARDMH